MNILYLAHRIPYPPDRGDKLRAFRQVERLAKGHDVWCACFVDRPSDSQYIEPLSTYCQDVAAVPLNRTRATVRGLAGLVRGRTITETFYQSTAMNAALRRWTESVRFDAVVAFSSSMAPYALTIPTRRRVVDLCDLDSRKWLDYAAASHGPVRWLYKKEGTRLATREQAWIGAFDATFLITESEAAALGEVASPEKVHIVGNGVILPNVPAGRADATDPTVGFVGVMDYRPNVDAVDWFVSTCWPRIRDACPQAVFRIVGRQPTRRVRRLARANGVEVVGEVDDVQAEVQRFQVSVAPMRIARGLQNKVLEAMAAARPVVLTSKAAEGIAGRDGQEYSIADHAEDIAETVVQLLRDETRRRWIGLNARQFVAAYYSWERELEKLELIVTGATRPATEHRRALQVPASPKTKAPARVFGPTGGFHDHA